MKFDRKRCLQFRKLEKRENMRNVCRGCKYIYPLGVSSMEQEQYTNFNKEINTMMRKCNQLAHDKGFWDSVNKGEKIALMHSELSEALEGLRHNNPKSDHIPPMSLVEEELADCVIRIFDFCSQFEIDLSAAIVVKHEFNKSREPKHGKQF